MPADLRGLLSIRSQPAMALLTYLQGLKDTDVTGLLPFTFSQQSIDSTRVVLLGGPGSGKTEFLRKSAQLLAAAEWQVVFDRTKPWEDVQLPMVLSAVAVRDADTDPDPSVLPLLGGASPTNQRLARAIVEALVRQHGCLREMADWLYRRLLSSGREPGSAGTLYVDDWHAVGPLQPPWTAIDELTSIRVVAAARQFECPSTPTRWTEVMLPPLRWSDLTLDHSPNAKQAEQNQRALEQPDGRLTGPPFLAVAYCRHRSWKHVVEALEAQWAARSLVDLLEVERKAVLRRVARALDAAIRRTGVPTFSFEELVTAFENAWGRGRTRLAEQTARDFLRHSRFVTQVNRESLRLEFVHPRLLATLVDDWTPAVPRRWVRVAAVLLLISVVLFWQRDELRPLRGFLAAIDGSPRMAAELIRMERWIGYEPTNYQPSPPRYPTVEEIGADLMYLKDYGFSGIVTYSMRDSLGQIPAVARSVDMKVLAGIRVAPRTNELSGWRFLSRIPCSIAARSGVPLPFLPTGIVDTELGEEIRKAISARQDVDGYIVGHNFLGEPEFLDELMGIVRCRTARPVSTTAYADRGNYRVFAERVDWLSPDLGARWRDGSATVEDQLQQLTDIFQESVNLASEFGKPALVQTVAFPSGGWRYTAEHQRAFFESVLRRYQSDPGYLSSNVGMAFFLGFDTDWKAQQTQDSAEDRLGIFTHEKKRKQVSCVFVTLPNSRPTRLYPSERVVNECRQPF